MTLFLKPNSSSPDASVVQPCNGCGAGCGWRVGLDGQPNSLCTGEVLIYDEREVDVGVWEDFHACEYHRRVVEVGPYYPEEDYDDDSEA